MSMCKVKVAYHSIFVPGLFLDKGLVKRLCIHVHVTVSLKRIIENIIGWRHLR